MTRWAHGSFAAAWIFFSMQAAACPDGLKPTENLWPFRLSEPVRENETTPRTAWLPPLLFSQPHNAGHAAGFRPIFVQWTSEDASRSRTQFLYPIFTAEKSPEAERWSFFELVSWRRESAAATTSAPEKSAERFDVFPFWLSKKSSEPDASYRALFPIFGTVKQRFGADEISFVAAPFYIRNETNGVRSTWTPWPFYGRFEGGGVDGFQLWPFYGKIDRGAKGSETFAAWPFYAKQTRTVEGGTAEYLAVLPFYMRRESPTARERVYGWPFFGWCERTQPTTYRETRYFWPLFVQGRGDSRTVDRWAPFYTHSVRKDSEKTWLLWPLWRNERWREAGLQQEKNQLLYFLYWDLKQEKPNQPAAHKTHLWPFFSRWDNAVGRTQFQLLSPLEVFFQHNESIRLNYSPLFAIARYESDSAKAFSRTSLFFGLFMHEQKRDAWRFSFGPLLDLGSAHGKFQFRPLPALFNKKPHVKPQP